MLGISLVVIIECAAIFSGRFEVIRAVCEIGCVLGMRVVDNLYPAVGWDRVVSEEGVEIFDVFLFGRVEFGFMLVGQLLVGR